MSVVMRKFIAVMGDIVSVGFVREGRVVLFDHIWWLMTHSNVSLDDVSMAFEGLASIPCSHDLGMVAV